MIVIFFILIIFINWGRVIRVNGSGQNPAPFGFLLIDFIKHDGFL